MLLVAIGFLNIVGKALAAEFDVDQIRELVDEMVVEHDFDSGELLALFDEAEKKERIIELISRPAEKAKPWHEYREIFVTDKRINAGVEFWEKNRESLEKARQIYGVEPHFIVSIIGVETFYGRITGGYRVLDSLATLSFGYPPRSKFLEENLNSFSCFREKRGRILSLLVDRMLARWDSVNLYPQATESMPSILMVMDIGIFGRIKLMLLEV